MKNEALGDQAMSNLGRDENAADADLLRASLLMNAQAAEMLAQQLYKAAELMDRLKASGAA